ncbi:MAG: transglutaminase-like domain-containing protein [Candidatus Hermodarchaeota archaeon]
MKRKCQFFIILTFILFSINFLTIQVHARPVDPPPTQDYAEFRNDPYPKGTNQMKIYYIHDSSGTMYIRLYKPNNYLAKSWSVGTGSGYLYYTGSVDGVWRIQCYRSGYTYWTDAALFHTFGIADPESGQGNLATDWARNPLNSGIYDQALSIIGQTTSQYLAVQKIYSHVVNHFIHYNHEIDDIVFRKDLDLLDDLNTYDHYYGVCRSDAVILTAYARALGIPARIIHLNADWRPHNPPIPDDPHYFAEYYFSYAGKYIWFPVDGDPIYDWCGLTEANQRISDIWDDAYWQIEIRIVTKIPYENIIDSGYEYTSYIDHPYRNDL